MLRMSAAYRQAATRAPCRHMAMLRQARQRAAGLLTAAARRRSPCWRRRRSSWPTASISASVSVWSGACRRTAIASDFLPSPRPAPAIHVEQRDLADQRLVRARAPRRAGSPPRPSSSTTKAKSRSTGGNGEALSGGRERDGLAPGLGQAVEKHLEADHAAARCPCAVQDRRMQLAELGQHGLRRRASGGRAGRGGSVRALRRPRARASALSLQRGERAPGHRPGHRTRRPARGGSAQWRSWFCPTRMPPATTSCSPGCGAEETRADLEQPDVAPDPRLWLRTRRAQQVGQQRSAASPTARR